MACCDLRSGEFHYCSHGHNPPYVVRAGGGAAEPITEVGGIPLGPFDGMGYIGSTVHLGARRSLFLYTDGVPKAQNTAELDLTVLA